jgi:hypothetical protein
MRLSNERPPPNPLPGSRAAEIVCGVCAFRSPTSTAYAVWMDSTIIYLAAFVTLVSVAVATSIIAVRRDGRGVENLIKQLIVWVAIVALMPLTSWAGATMIHPRTRMKDLMAQQQRAQQEANDTRDDAAARGKLYDESMRIGKLIEEERRLFYRAMFWVGFPIGLAALVVGLFLRHVAVGTGLAFGGLCTLTAGCYSYWDDMGDRLRFVSLLLVLGILIAIGLMKFGRPAPPAPAPAV